MEEPFEKILTAAGNLALICMCGLVSALCLFVIVVIMKDLFK